MEKFKTVESRPAPLDSSNVDTDQIIPKQFLKRIERTGFGQFLFFDWRFNDDGTENDDGPGRETRCRWRHEHGDTFTPLPHLVLSSPFLNKASSWFQP